MLNGKRQSTVHYDGQTSTSPVYEAAKQTSIAKAMMLLFSQSSLPGARFLIGGDLFVFSF